MKTGFADPEFNEPYQTDETFDDFDIDDVIDEEDDFSVIDPSDEFHAKTDLMNDEEYKQYMRYAEKFRFNEKAILKVENNDDRTLIKVIDDKNGVVIELPSSIKVNLKWWRQ